MVISCQALRSPAWLPMDLRPAAVEPRRARWTTLPSTSPAVVTTAAVAGMACFDLFVALSGPRFAVRRTPPQQTAPSAAQVPQAVSTSALHASPSCATFSSKVADGIAAPTWFTSAAGLAREASRPTSVNGDQQVAESWRPTRCWTSIGSTAPIGRRSLRRSRAQPRRLAPAHSRNPPFRFLKPRPAVAWALSPRRGSPCFRGTGRAIAMAETENSNDLEAGSGHCGGVPVAREQARSAAPLGRNTILYRTYRKERTGGWKTALRTKAIGALAT